MRDGVNLYCHHLNCLEQISLKDAFQARLPALDSSSDVSASQHDENQVVRNPTSPFSIATYLSKNPFARLIGERLACRYTLCLFCS